MTDRRLPFAAELAAAALVLAAVQVATSRWLHVGAMIPVAPFAGLALVLALLRGRRILWAALIGATLGNLASGLHPLASLFAGAAVTGGVAIMHVLLAGPLRFDARLERASDAAALAAAAIAGSLLSGAALLPIALASPTSVHGHDLVLWCQLWLSQALGVLVAAPPLLVLTADRGPLEAEGRALEVGACVTAALSVAILIFLTPSFVGLRTPLFTLVVLPLSAWVILRGDRRISLTLCSTILLMELAGSSVRLGIFARSSTEMAIRGLQSITGGFAMFCLLLAANESERRGSTRALREREARLQRVFEGSNDGFWDWDFARDHVDWSERAARMMGYEDGRMDLTRDEFAKLIHPEDHEASRKVLSEHLRQGVRNYDAEYRVRRRNGEWMWLHVRGRVHVRGPAGEPLRVSGTMTDITERKQAELSLRASQELFENFMRYSPAIAFIRDVAGRLHWVNAAYERFMWSDEPTDWRGRNISELFPPETVTHLTESDQSVIETGTSLVVEQHLNRPAGELVWLVAKFPIRSAGGETLIGATAVDITERRRAEEQRLLLDKRMAEAQKLEGLGLLAGGVAHDFNNILTGILGHADLARDRVPAGSDARSHLDEIMRGAHSAAELTRQMLAYAGRGSVVPQLLNLGALVADMRKLLSVSIPRRLELREEIERGLPMIAADEEHLRQVVMNLVLNAAESMEGRTGDIVLRLHAASFTREQLVSRWSADNPAAGDYVVLEVADTGCGMSDATLGRIFDPFFSTKFTGRGLGLAAVLGIVRMHGGTVQIETAPDRGTRFRALFPALPSAAAAAAGPAAAPAEWRGSGTALVVDDEPGVREMAATMLRRLGFANVLLAGGGHEGIELFRANAAEIRVVLLDVTMPDVDGVSAMRAMREIRPDTCIVFSSGYMELEDGGDLPFVPKPYRLKDLATTLQKAMEAVSA